MTAASMAPIKPDRVGNYELAHKLAQISLGSLNQQMKVIIHQNVGDKFDTESLTAINQMPLITLFVLSVNLKDLTPISLTPISDPYFLIFQSWHLP